ncbi:MAG: DUF6503 family protein [Saprospiraceae bacterium]|nr:hypothetical protein [Lewinella sp.]
MHRSAPAYARLFLLILLSSLFACRSNPAMEETDTYAHLQDPVVRDILQKAIAYAGGLETWRSIRRLQYTKDFSLLLESGALEKRYEQVHDYQYDPLRIEIRSLENGDQIITRLEDGIYSRTENGQMSGLSQQALEDAVNASTYVVGMLFSLLDPAAVILYAGKDTLPDKRAVDVLQVTYENGAEALDVWKYYFDEEGKIVANWVDTGDHFSLVENLTFERANGILFNGIRKSYRVDSSGNKLYLRAEYTYGNYNVER